MSDLPVGIVALLFTDVEASTRLVQELGDDYSRVMADHRRLIREANREERASVRGIFTPDVRTRRCQ